MSSVTPAIEAELRAVHGLYTAFMRDVAVEEALGGKLFWAGLLGSASMRAIRAASIAGAASLCATTDTSTLREAQRTNAVDFQVTSLDESLRILKNEIRKRQPVAVAIHADPIAVWNEMQERGVVPDLNTPDSASDSASGFFAFAMPAGSNADLDAQILALISESDIANRRWYRLASRYFGREMRSIRSLNCGAATAQQVRALLG